MDRRGFLIGALAVGAATATANAAIVCSPPGEQGERRCHVDVPRAVGGAPEDPVSP